MLAVSRDPLPLPCLGLVPHPIAWTISLGHAKRALNATFTSLSR